MPSPFRVLIYDNPVRSNVLRADWSNFVESLNFSTNAFGGYATASFNLKQNFSTLLSYIVGQGTNKWTGNRIRVIGPGNVVAYEGMLYALTLRAGSDTEGRSMDSVYNVARIDYSVNLGKSVETRSQWYDDATSRATYGKKSTRMDLPGNFSLVTTTPTSVARRYIKQHRTPGEPNTKKKGGAALDLVMEVACVGLTTPALEWRSAFSNFAGQVDTSVVIKDMLATAQYTEGTPNAARGRAGSGWVEILDAARTLEFTQQFISPSSFGNIAASGTLVERNIGSGGQRIDIVKQAAQYGSSNDKRMMFQVWDDGTANSGLGIAYFTEGNEIRPFFAGYTGYYDEAHKPIVYDRNSKRIDMWKVRAGQWITTLGLVPNTNYPNIYDDPRCFWIEETSYDADNMTLTLTGADTFNIEQYVGRLIGGNKVIKGQL